MTPTSSFLVNRFTLVGTTVQNFDIDLERFNLQENKISLQGKGGVGAGAVTVTYLVSCNGTDFIAPTGATALITALGTGGAAIGSVTLPACAVLRLVFTPTNNLVADFWISMR